MQNTNGRIAFIILKVKITADILEKRGKKLKANHQTSQKNMTKRVLISKYQSHQDSSLDSNSSNSNSSTSSIESNYLMEGKNINSTKAILSMDVLLGTQADNMTF